MDTTLVTPTTHRMVGRVTVTAGTRKIVVGIDADSPSFYRFVEGKRLKEGKTLRPVRFRGAFPQDSMLFDGSGYWSGGGECNAASTGPQSPHGGGGGGSLSRGFMLRAGQTISFEVDYDIASDSPWVGTNYAPVFRVRGVTRDVGDGSKLYPKGMPQLKHPVTLRPPAPAVFGRLAARIDIANTGDIYSKEPGVIKGSIAPAEAGRTVNFSAIRWRDWRAVPAEPTPIGSAVTAADGSFVFAAAGVLKSKAGYSVIPSYPAQAGELLPDNPCPFSYMTRKPEMTPLPAEITIPKIP
jgi:hypothetical protein